MDDRMMAQAEAAQIKLKSLIENRSGIVGMGIGLDASRKGLALKVLLDRPDAAEGLPKEVDGIPVQTTVTGPITAN